MGRMSQRLIIFGNCFGLLVLLGEHVSPALERISEVRGPRCLAAP
jgi:hypothetical protein